MIRPEETLSKKEEVSKESKTFNTLYEGKFF